MTSIHQSPLTTSPSMYVDEVEEDFDEVVARLDTLDLYEVDLDEVDDVDVDVDVDVDEDVIDSIQLMFLEAGEDYTSMFADVEDSVFIANEFKIITSKTRARYVDWVIKATECLHFSSAALHLAVKYLDRCLSGNSGDAMNMDNLHTVLKMAGSEPEMKARVLSYLNHEVATVPTAYRFLNSYVGAAQRGRHAPLQGLDRVAAYVADVSLLSTAMLRFSPWMVAASSVFLAQYILDPNCSEKPWSVVLRDCTMFEASDLQECVLALHKFWCSDESNWPAITAKHYWDENGIAALKIIPPAIPLHTFEAVYI